MQDIGLLRLTDQGESPIGAIRRGSYPYTGRETARLYRYSKQSTCHEKNHLAGPAGLLPCTQCPKEPGDPDGLPAYVTVGHVLTVF